MQTATLVGPGLGLEVIEREYTVGPSRPGLDGCGAGGCLGVISQQNYWSTARSGGANGLGLATPSFVANHPLLVAVGAIGVGLVAGFFLGRR